MGVFLESLLGGLAGLLGGLPVALGQPVAGSVLPWCAWAGATLGYLSGLRRYADRRVWRSALVMGLVAAAVGAGASPSAILFLFSFGVIFGTLWGWLTRR